MPHSSSLPTTPSPPTTPAPSRYQSAGGTVIYTLSVRVFGDVSANVYLLQRGDYLALVDTGSGSPTSNADLLAGLAAASHHYGEGLTLEKLSRIVLTHGHIDHYGGLDFVRSRSNAPIAIHALDAAMLTHPAERRSRQRRALHAFARAAGMPAGELEGWLGQLKPLPFVGAAPQTLLEDGEVLDGLLEVLHLPGHCPGQVALRLDEVLLSADQLLAHTTPHLLSATMLPGCGLELYLASLRRVEGLPGIAVSLGGHEAPVTDIAGRSAAIRASYARKLERLCALCPSPQTVYQIYRLLYPRVRGHDQLLALEKTGAMVEYLHTRGVLLLDNLSELAHHPDAPPRYRLAEGIQHHPLSQTI